jgi:diguanylate cyclase (GGDEF)-like protein
VSEVRTDRVPAPARETSGATTRLVVGYVRERSGEAGVAELLRRAQIDRPVAELEDESVWSPYDERIRLFEAAIDVTGEPDAMFEIGASALRQRVSHSLILLLRAMGSPKVVFRQLARAVPKFTTTSTMEVLDAGRTHATIRYRLHDGYEHSRLDCRYAQGLFSVIPQFWGLPPAHIEHEECQSDGHDACLYRVTWSRRSRLGRRGARRRAASEIELVALRGQLEALQSAAAELVGSDDLDTVLDRITQMATKAVLAQGYLLAVDGPDGSPLVRFAGIAADRAEDLASALRRGDDLGPSAVVVEVASSRRNHGHLAALYVDGHRGLLHEQHLLAAYAGHAAAALDLLLALEESRAGHRTAQALLGLASDLARAGTEREIAEIAAAALPVVAGAERATVLLWNADQQALLPVAAHGLTGENELTFFGVRLKPARVRELDEMLAQPHARLLRRDEVDEPLRALLDELGTGSTAVAPLLADGELLGVISAGWTRIVAPEVEHAVLESVAGLADQTTTALQNARLLTQIRHQAVHDALTGLPNRVRFAEALDAALAEPPEPPASVAVLFCDLDSFKSVNDTFGHIAGDELLRQVSGRLRAAVRSGDVVARLAGDEFALLLPVVASEDAAEALAATVLECFERPFVVEGAVLDVTASVGVAVHWDTAATGETLLRRADAAMYEAKHSGRNRIAMASPFPPAVGRRAADLQPHV